MISFRLRRAARPAVDAQLFRRAMGRPAVARELFLPLGRAWWDGGRYTLGRWAARGRGPRLAGVRLQEPGPAAAGAPPERDTQADLRALVGSVAELRRQPGLEGVVLSAEALAAPQAGAVPGKRLVFGLRVPAFGRGRPEAAAARECHRAIRRAVERAGYRVVHPLRPPDPAAGFAGLLEWAGAVRLRRKRRERRWLLLLPLLLLLPWAFPGCPSKPSTLFGISVDTEGFIILLDKSGSMGDFFGPVRDEAKKLLLERLQAPGGPPCADLIVYDAQAESVLGGLEPVTPERVAAITAYLDNLTAGGHTNLAAAIDVAGPEVARRGLKTTTLIVLTDGEDTSLAQMVKDKDKVRAKFGGAPFTVRATTPRLFAPGADPKPDGPAEKDLAEFCKTFGGKFGPAGGAP
jgi:hypothetical protein